MRKSRVADMETKKTIGGKVIEREEMIVIRRIAFSSFPLSRCWTRTTFGTAWWVSRTRPLCYPSPEVVAAVEV